MSGATDPLAVELDDVLHARPVKMRAVKASLLAAPLAPKAISTPQCRGGERRKRRSVGSVELPPVGEREASIRGEVRSVWITELANGEGGVASVRLPCGRKPEPRNYSHQEPARALRAPEPGNLCTACFPCPLVWRAAGAHARGPEEPLGDIFNGLSVAAPVPLSDVEASITPPRNGPAVGLSCWRAL